MAHHPRLRPRASNVMLLLIPLLVLSLKASDAQPFCPPTGDPNACPRILGETQIPFQFLDPLPKFPNIRLDQDQCCEKEEKLTIYMREGEGFFGKSISFSIPSLFHFSIFKIMCQHHFLKRERKE